MKPSRLLLVLRFLTEQTDEQHTVSIKDINEYLEPYGLAADRKTIMDCIRQLQDSGENVIVRRSTNNRYCIGQRKFSDAEAKLLVDAVQSSKFISVKKSKELIGKISDLVGTHKGEILQRQLYVDKHQKADNPELMRIVDELQKAIQQKVKVAFQYYEYDGNMKKILRHSGEKYCVSPYVMVWNNDLYYLIGFNESRELVQKFRIDRIVRLNLLSDRIIRKPTGFKIEDFFTKEFSMMNGESCVVTLLCEDPLMNSIVDRYGTKVKIGRVDDNHFTAEVEVSLSGNFYGWVLASEGAMKIVNPQKAVAGLKAIVENYSD